MGPDFAVKQEIRVVVRILGMVDSLRRFPAVAGFDEVANRNRMGEVRSCPLNQFPPDTSVQEVFDSNLFGRSTYPLSPVIVGVLLLEPLCESEP